PAGITPTPSGARRCVLPMGCISAPKVVPSSPHGCCRSSPRWAPVPEGRATRISRIIDQPRPTLAIIPAYNEEAALGAVLGELNAALPELDVLVVSDGSRDRTAAIARTAGAHVVE